MKPSFRFSMRTGPRDAAACLLFWCAVPALAQDSASTWQFGAVLDVAAASRALELGERDQGLGLGHSDVTAYGLLGRHVEARLTGAAHTHDGKLEGHLEEAWLESRTLPAGWQLRGGRFDSQLGYLNEQHPHSDDFVERPLLYRSFLGGHWNDDGLRLNWTAPTDLYLRLGAEVFGGRQLVEESASHSLVGAGVLSARLGGDLGASQSWQTGLSLVYNRRASGQHEEHDEDEHHDDEEHEEHEHAHGAVYTGRRMWVLDTEWKWAPGGNNSQQQLRLSFEHARIQGDAPLSGQYQASYLAAVWRFAPAWEAGVRADLLKTREQHEDGIEEGRLREGALMLAYKPTHAQTARLQFTRQMDRGGFPDAVNAVQLQYILSFGRHAAHSF